MKRDLKQETPSILVIPAYSGQIPVCLRCSDRDIRPQGIREGLWPGGGEGVAWVCNQCGHIGPPLLLDPEDKEPSERDRAWQDEYQAMAKRLEENSTSVNAGRSTRNLGIVFLVVAAIFFLPPVLLLINTLISDPGMFPAALGQSWIFLGIATVALVLGVRKVDLAAKMDAEDPIESPLAQLEKAVEKDQTGK